AAGEVASELAISTLVRLALDTPDWILSGQSRDVEQILQRFADRYGRIQAILHAESDRDPSLRGMGTTMTLACSLGTSLLLGHIGDSRAYIFRDNALCQLTRDHTLVQALVDSGQLTAEQAARHPMRHALSQVLGAGDSSRGDFCHVWLRDSDQLLLCTDGL